MFWNQFWFLLIFWLGQTSCREPFFLIEPTFHRYLATAVCCCKLFWPVVTAAKDNNTSPPTRWASKWPLTWKTAWTATSSTCSAPFGRSAARASRTRWFSRRWRRPNTWRCTRPPSTGSCSASPTEPQRWTRTHTHTKFFLLRWTVLSWEVISWCSHFHSGPADGDDGEMQEAGQQVSAAWKQLRSDENSEWPQLCVCFPQCLAVELSHEGVQARVRGGASHRLHRHDQRLRWGWLPQGETTWIWHMTAEWVSHTLWRHLLSPAPAVRLSGTQSGLRRPPRTREADDPERSLEGGHQSPQPSGTYTYADINHLQRHCILTQRCVGFDFMCRFIFSGLH